MNENNMEQLLEDALDRVRDMTCEEFYQICVDAGYTPIRREVDVPFTQEEMRGALNPISEARKGRKLEKFDTPVGERKVGRV